jgi:uncharacterized small protein (DUF1192 family)
MLTDDDFDPRTKKMKARPLDMLSVDQLREYIADLKAEIARAEADIARKESSRHAADSFFKKPPA